MAGATQRIPTRGPAYEQNDPVEKRQRVATYVDGPSVAYEGSLTTGPDVTCDFYTDSSYSGKFPSRRAHYGYLINDGPGDLQVFWSPDGTNYGGVHTVKVGEQLSFDGFTVKTLKLRWVTDTEYRVMLM